jgi:hypothetical protein
MKPMNHDVESHENVAASEQYAAGCACTECRTFGLLPVESGESCTVTRHTDSNA